MIEVKRVAAGEAILNEAAIAVPTEAELLEHLVRQHSRLVYRIAYAALRSHHEAEDATQETFVRVLRYGKRIAALEDAKSWLARIAWRVAVDRSKRRSRKAEVSLDDPQRPVEEAASPDAGADERLQSTEVGSLVEKLIAALPVKLREPLLLSALQEMSPREVAATLEISEAAVRSRVFRARQILRAKLAERHFGLRLKR